MTQAVTPEPGEPAKPARGARARGWIRDILLFAVLVLAINAWKTRDLLPDNTPLPEELVIYTLDGEPVLVSSFAPDAVMIHVWATWCGVCGVEHPALEKVHENTREGERLVTVAVSSGSAEDVRAYMADHDITYPVYLAGDAFVDALRVRAYPTNYFVSPAGRVRATTVGATTRWGMRSRLRAAARAE